ncbi:dephospho-CoA kinase [Parasynechococcus sp.]|uniref:dephospho-CoA kinase n=1 Tax=Parasynechococcus sp. TaxID=3101203 RepID=UPI003704A380
MAPGETFSQRRIGLTGGIASGKSSVGRWLAQQGLPVLDADQYAREALAPGRPATNTVLQRYGSTVQAGDDAAVERAALGHIVFQDPAERWWLEQLIHPIVRELFDEALSLHAKTPAIVLMIPLLFEAGLESLCSEIWLVDCDQSQQLERLIARDGLSPEAAQARIAAQWPLSRKRGLADHVIANRGQPGVWKAQAVDLLNQPQKN